jgi:prepilin-type N-terminal cleavage/methylation domain-containing protein
VARERGFTLIEVLVALTVGALGVLLAHQLFAGLADRGRALIGARAALDREANARRWLAATFLSLEVGADSARGFEGRPDRVTFTVWLRVPDGWFEREQVTLGRELDRLVAIVTPGGPVALMDSVTDLAFDYLLEPGAESGWVREWVSPVSAPLAVRLRARRAMKKRDQGIAHVDTLLFLIKERG